MHDAHVYTYNHNSHGLGFRVKGILWARAGVPAAVMHRHGAGHWLLASDNSMS